MNIPDQRRLRLLSYNIQAGAFTRSYRHYVTESWKHVLPDREKRDNLDRIAGFLGHYDIVGLQEVDSGSFRSGFIDQTEYLARHAGYPYWHKQVNRSLGVLGQHSNGLLSRMQPSQVDEYRLPGLPGRGVFLANYGSRDGLNIVILHLALSKRGRMRQVEFVSSLIAHLKYVVLMGDLNCGSDSTELQVLTESGRLKALGDNENTFPSWQPVRKVDHILVSEALEIENARVIDYPMSDHLPVGVDVILPEGLQLAA